MLLDDFSVIEYKDEDISQKDLRTVLSMFSDIVQEIIRPKTKKKTLLQKYFSKDKEVTKEGNDESLAKDAIGHDIYQQHEHLQDEEIKEVEEKVGTKHIITQHPGREQKEGIPEENNPAPIDTNQSGAYQSEENNMPENQGFEEEKNNETKKQEDNGTHSVLWAEENTTTSKENTEQENIIKQERPEVEVEESEKAVETNLANETSWIADAPIYTKNNETEKQETEDEDFPFNTITTNENKAKSIPEFKEETTTEKQETETIIPENTQEKTSSPLPEFTTTNNNETSPAVESVEEDLQEVIKDLDVGIPKREENKAATDLKDLAEQLKAVIKKEHLEGEYQETSSLTVEADNIEQLIETAERLIVEKNKEEAKSVYQEILGKYNSLTEEEKHHYFEKIQLLYNLLA